MRKTGIPGLRSGERAEDLKRGRFALAVAPRSDRASSSNGNGGGFAVADRHDVLAP
jgi:hypothetical protein